MGCDGALFRLVGVTMFEIGLVWLAGAVVVSILAGSRGRSSLGWFVLAVVFSPLLMLVLVLGLPSRRALGPIVEPVSGLSRYRSISSRLDDDAARPR
jgi:hypothetical protein